MNEPFAGDFWHNPFEMVPIPGIDADTTNFQAAYDEISTTVRTVNPDVLIFFAGVTWDDFGVQFKHAPGGD